MHISFYLLLIATTVMALACGKPDSAVVSNEPLPAASEGIVGYTSVPFPVVDEMVLVKKGTYIPLYGQGKTPVSVQDFEMDVYPITNEQYLAFVKSNPQWRKSAAKEIFADKNYLHAWPNDTSIAAQQSLNAPVTNVSWFAANAYCTCLGKRLPTLDEWEYVAMADESTTDARKNPSYNQYILDWYEKPKTYNNDIGRTYKNAWGIYDLHGLVWEWTDDFSAVLISGENRGGAGSDQNLFCGSGSVGANDLMNYAAFMRYAFRGSLKANYSVQNLGFRCAKDIKQQQQ